MSTTNSNGNQDFPSLDLQHAIAERYSAASRAVEPELCCAVDYDPKYLDVLPAELIERDYGCGDPSKYVAEGEAVLDLGSGGGKICYIASQIVGPAGRVIGVDMNDDMLALARNYRDEISARIGFSNVEFHKGRIQDLALDLEQFSAYLGEHPIDGADGWIEAQQQAEELRRTRPMIAADSIDVVLSNCVLNLVEPQDRGQLFAEMFRVLRRGGRAVISDIICDEPVPDALRNNPKLWSGCISGAFLEHELLEQFEQAGFYGVEIVARQPEPWAVVEGIEFRSLSVRAFKGKEGPCNDHLQAVIYKGPFKSVTDDDGHVIRRGVRTAVCAKTFEIYSRPPYADQFIAVSPHVEVPPQQAQPFSCRAGATRDPRETKLASAPVTQLPISDCCGPDDCC